MSEIPTGIKVIFAILLAGLVYVFFGMFSPQEGTRKAFTALDKERMEDSLQYAMDVVSMFGRTPNAKVNAVPLARLVAETMNEMQKKQVEFGAAEHQVTNAPISYVLWKPTGTWQVVLTPLEDPCRIQYKGYGFELDKPLIEFTQECLVRSP